MPLRRVLTSSAALALVAGLGVACSDVEDAARDAVGDAACSAVSGAVDEAGQQAGDAATQIGADPQAAKHELRALRDALAAAERGVDGDVKAKLSEAEDATADLLDEAERAAEGADVDMRAVDRARDDLQTAVDDVKDVC